MLSSYHRNRILLLTSAVVSFALFWWAGKIFHIPANPGYSASLLQQPSSLVVMLVTAITLVASVLISTIIAGRIRFDAGLFGAALGLCALSLRGGPMRYAVMNGGGPRVYLLLLVELILLYGIVVLAWSVLWLLHRQGWLQADAFRDGVEDVEDPLGQRLLALLAQVAVMFVVVWILGRTDDKKQALAAVGLGAWLGTLAAHSLAPVRPSIWYWIGPLIVGVAGYFFAFLAPGDWQVGEVASAMSTPLPLDYASFGPAGAIAGYWMSRRWQRAREVAQEQEKPARSKAPASAASR